MNDLVFLHVDDDPVDATLFKRALKKQGVDVAVRCAADGADGLRQLREIEPHRVIVFLDLNMPGVNGHDFLAELRNDEAYHRAIVFVLTSSQHDRDIAAAYDRHVAGYFIKDDIHSVVETVKTYAKAVRFPPVGTA